MTGIPLFPSHPGVKSDCESDEGVEVWKLIKRYQKVLDSAGETLMKSIPKRGVVPATVSSQHSELKGVVTYRAGSLLEPNESSGCF